MNNEHFMHHAHYLFVNKWKDNLGEIIDDIKVR